MLVYRMEHPAFENGGPYNGGKIPGYVLDQLNRMHAAHSMRFGDMGRPTPWGDGVIDFYQVYGDPAWVCGCDTRQKLEWWFEGYMDKLFDLGFALTTYEVAGDQVMTGIQQVVFNKDYATLIESEVRIKELEAA